MKANSRSPRHYEKLKSDAWQTWERMWVQLISCIGVHIHHLTSFHEDVPTEFFLSSQHSGPVAPPLYCLVWSRFYNPVFLYQWPLRICALPFPGPHDRALPCAVLGTTHISAPSALAAVRISSVLETPRMWFHVVTPPCPLSLSADISHHIVLFSSLSVSPLLPLKAFYSQLIGDSSSLPSAPITGNISKF